MAALHTFYEATMALRRFYNAPGSNTYTLERMQQLMRYLGDPQNDLRIIHVAGTSGKTSTAYYAAALLKAVGLKVGLTVSPHVDQVNERVQIGLAPLPEAEFCGQLTAFLALVTRSGILPSYFETLIAFAYWQFQRRQVDYAVVEVGLGGLLDGTNVVERPDKICIITDIGLDHTAILGSSLPAIAQQKAGIIRPGNEVFMYEQAAGIMDAVAACCCRQTARLHVAEAPAISRTSLLPLFQQRNFQLANQAVEYGLRRDTQAGLTVEQRRQAAKAYVPGRMELLHLPGKTVILDGAHNEQKMEALLASVQARFPNQELAALVASVEGQDERWQRLFDVLMPAARHLMLTAFALEQDTPKLSVAPDRLAGYLRGQGYHTYAVEPNLQTALPALLNRPEPVLVVTGSLYLLHCIRPLLPGESA